MRAEHDRRRRRAVDGQKPHDEDRQDDRGQGPVPEETSRTDLVEAGRDQLSLRVALAEVDDAPSNEIADRRRDVVDRDDRLPRRLRPTLSRSRVPVRVDPRQVLVAARPRLDDGPDAEPDGDADQQDREYEDEHHRLDPDVHDLPDHPGPEDHHQRGDDEKRLAEGLRVERPHVVVADDDQDECERDGQRRQDPA